MSVPLALPSISTEFVSVPFTASVPVTGVELALVLPAVLPAPADWRPATYDGATARILVGPEGGAVQLAPGVMYVLWLRADAGVEHPARPCGYVYATDQVPA